MKIHSYEIGNDQSFSLIAGPCVIEGRDITIDIAGRLAEITRERGIQFIFKASLDKANRTSGGSFRGIGWDEGLAILTEIKQMFNVPVITDVHEGNQVDSVAAVCDALQIPAFLCRQTDFVQKVASAHLPVNIKKGQWMAPEDMGPIVEKCLAVGNDRIMLCERGVAFGPHNLVVDMRGLVTMAELGNPVIFDATHSVQKPGGLGNKSGGDRRFAPVLARAALAVGVAGLFIETHPNPDIALSDGPNMIPLADMPGLLDEFAAIDHIAKRRRT